jgi:hypothetical protein
MEVYKPSRRTFLPTLERTEPVLIDHTALYCAKSCPRKYFFQIVLGRSPKATAPYFAFGSAYHKFREILETQSKGGRDGVRSMDAFTAALGGALGYMARSERSEGSDKWDYLTPQRLEQCCKVAYEWWKRERAGGAIEVLATEQSFNVALRDGRFRAGRADQIVLYLGELYGRDFKTTSKAQGWYARGLEPNEQFIGYTWAESKLAGKPVRGQLIEVLFNEKGKDPFIHSFLVEYTPEQLDRFETEHLMWNRMLDMWREDDIYPMNESHCTFCTYREVCKMKSERAMLYMLEADYDYKPWDCTTVHLTT